MKKNHLLIGLMALAMAATALTACTDNDTPAPDGPGTDTPGSTPDDDNALVQLSFTADPEHDPGQSAYVIAAQVRAGTSTENVILTGEMNSSARLLSETLSDYYLRHRQITI